MPTDRDGGPIGNQDPSKRGFGKRPDREQGSGDGSTPPKRPRGQAPGYGDVTKTPKKD